VDRTRGRHSVPAFHRSRPRQWGFQLARKTDKDLPVLPGTDNNEHDLEVMLHQRPTPSGQHRILATGQF